MYEMDFSLARRLVWESIRAVTSRHDLIEDDDVTLYELGLWMRPHREHFRELLASRIYECGYEINPTAIPTYEDTTVRHLTMLLPGESTKGNKP